MPVIISLIITFNYLLLNKSRYIENINKPVFFSILLIMVIPIFINFINFKNYKLINKNYNEEISSIISFINHHNNSNFLIDGGPIYKFYTNSDSIYDLTYPTNEIDPQFLLRKNRKYINLKEDIKKNKFDFIIIEKRRKYKQETLKYLIENNYKIKNNGNYKIYYLFKN